MISAGGDGGCLAFMARASGGRDTARHTGQTSSPFAGERLMAAMDHFNEDPVVHTWTHKLDKAA